MNSARVVNIHLAWKGMKLGPPPKSIMAAREINWPVDGAPRLPDLETDHLTAVVERAEQTGLTVQLWIEGKRVTDLRQAHRMQTLAVCGWKKDSGGRWHNPKISEYALS